jgi:tRNA (mo5U34)-methyltransferase
MSPATQTIGSRSVDLGAAVASNPLWYHTLELAPGVVTPGWFDLRPIVDRLPWPDVRGKRCLDIGTYDGFLAFELERRGAADVVATDIEDHDRWDWPPDVRALGPERLALLAGPEKSKGFRIAKEALGSAVERVALGVYDLSPDRIGSFDVVVCGSLLLHLRDPLRALEAARSVCHGVFLSAEDVELSLTALHPRRPLAQLNGSGERLQWWVPNAAGHERMLFAAGFEIERRSRPYCVPLGPGHRYYRARRGARSIARSAFRRVLTGGTGRPHVAVLARPRV